MTLCGEIAGRPLDAMALAAIGYRSLSMASAAIGPVKAMIRALDCSCDAESDRPSAARDAASSASTEPAPSGISDVSARASFRDLRREAQQRRPI